MSYELGYDFYIGSQNAGLTLAGQIYDSSGTPVGAEITTGFVDGGKGHYYILVTTHPDGHVGKIEFYESGDSGNPLASFAVNPQEGEYTDVKTSTRSDGTGVTLADGAITAAKIATDAIGADELAADAIAEIVADIFSEEVPGAYASGSAGVALGRIGSGTFAVTVTNPVAQSGNVTTYMGDDYNNTDGRALEWTQSSGDGWPTSLSGATIAVYIEDEATFAGEVVTPTGDSKKIRLELTASETNSIPGSENGNTYNFQIVATHSSKIATLVEGTWTSIARTTGGS